MAYFRQAFRHNDQQIVFHIVGVGKYNTNGLPCPGPQLLLVKLQDIWGDSQFKFYVHDNLLSFCCLTLLRVSLLSLLQTGNHHRDRLQIELLLFIVPGRERLNSILPPRSLYKSSPVSRRCNYTRLGNPLRREILLLGKQPVNGLSRSEEHTSE